MGQNNIASIKNLPSLISLDIEIFLNQWNATSENQNISNIMQTCILLRIIKDEYFWTFGFCVSTAICKQKFDFKNHIHIHFPQLSYQYSMHCLCECLLDKMLFIMRRM